MVTKSRGILRVLSCVQGRIPGKRLKSHQPRRPLWTKGLFWKWWFNRSSNVRDVDRHIYVYPCWWPTFEMVFRPRRMKEKKNIDGESINTFNIRHIHSIGRSIIVCFRNSFSQNPINRILWKFRAKSLLASVIFTSPTDCVYEGSRFRYFPFLLLYKFLITKKKLSSL